MRGFSGPSAQADQVVTACAVLMLVVDEVQKLGGWARAELGARPERLGGRFALPIKANLCIYTYVQ
jgi:hypothetical protein